jgi:hypothetical protein
LKRLSIFVLGFSFVEKIVPRIDGVIILNNATHLLQDGLALLFTQTSDPFSSHNAPPRCAGRTPRQIALKENAPAATVS